MGNRFKTIAAGGLIAAAVVVGGAAVPANAAASNCAAAGFYACIWEDTSFKTNSLDGGLIGFKRYIPKFGTWVYKSTTISGHDTATSAKSTANFTNVRFFKNENYDGSPFILSPGGQDADFSNGSPAGNFNDTLDSGIFEDEM